LGNGLLVVYHLQEEVFVYFDFCCFNPTDFGSFRGFYSDLAIGYEQLPTPSTIKDFRLKLQAIANGQTFTGWKGGSYNMDGDSRIWVANSGEATETVLIDAIYIPDNERLVLKTDYFPYSEVHWG
jgi:hypothetical protein